MRIGLLICGHIAPGLREATLGADYPELYETLLAGADADLTFRSYDLVGGEFPAAVDSCDGWLISGSTYDADGTEPWILALHDLIRELWEARARTVGICFGHQAVAHALGGRVERAVGWKAGPMPLEVEPTLWFEGGRVNIHAMHRDVVSELPLGAAPLGSGATAEHPMFMVGESILCIQDHPEFERRFMMALIESRRSRLGDAEADAALDLTGTVQTDNAVVADWMVKFLRDASWSR
jgi:GMP synthase-like glutamine amidotransferase